MNITDGRLFLYNSTIPHIRINKTSGDTASTRFILGIATGTDSFITGATQNTCCIKTGGNNMMFGIGTDKKLEINSTGIEVTGNIEPEADNTRVLGSSSKRFSTLHSAALNTGDINMSNLNDSGNEVDGSKGSWTLQEGADDLFIINRVSGKKYKFNLTEIS